MRRIIVFSALLTSGLSFAQGVKNIEVQIKPKFIDSNRLALDINPADDSSLDTEEQTSIANLLKKLIASAFLPEIDGEIIPLEISNQSPTQVVAHLNRNSNLERSLNLGACLSDWYSKQNPLDQLLFDGYVHDNDTKVIDFKESFDGFYEQNSKSCRQAKVAFESTPMRAINGFLEDLSKGRSPQNSVLADFTKDTLAKIEKSNTTRLSELLLAAVKKWISNIRSSALSVSEKPSLDPLFAFVSANPSKANLSMLSYLLLDASAVKKLSLRENQSKYRSLSQVAQAVGNACIRMGVAESTECTAAKVGEKFFWLDVLSPSGNFSFGLEK